MKLTGAQILCESLLKEGVDTIFGILGGQILPIYDTLTQYPQLHHILTGHEQGAAHAAEGYARATGKVGVCFATSGPRRHQPGDRHRRRLHGFHSHGGHHRAGGAAS